MNKFVNSFRACPICHKIFQTHGEQKKHIKKYRVCTLIDFLCGFRIRDHE